MRDEPHSIVEQVTGMGTLKPNMPASLRAIRDVLSEKWDPIGLRGVVKAQDEYDSYIMPLYTLLRQRSSETQIVEHLYVLETRHMGLTRADRHRLQSIARELLSIDVGADEPLVSPSNQDGNRPGRTIAHGAQSPLALKRRIGSELY
jgi:hypothetical protein